MGNLDKSKDVNGTQPTAVALSDDDWDLTDIERHSIVADWFENGIRCVIMRNVSFCGYVGVPIDHPLAGFDYESIPLDCHGGLTFAGKLEKNDGWYFYGWDYAHAGDFCDFYLEKIDNFPHSFDEKKWTFGEVKQEVREVLWDFQRLVKLAERLSQRLAETQKPTQRVLRRNRGLPLRRIRMDESTYNLAYWLTYGVFPSTYKPMAPGELQKLLEKIAPKEKKLKP